MQHAVHHIPRRVRALAVPGAAAVAALALSGPAAAAGGICDPIRWGC